MCLLPRGAIVAFVASSQRAEKEEQGMNYMDFDPYVIEERNQQVHREVHSLRLEERLREERGSSGSRLVALAKRGVRPLLREAHRAG
jgi:hypothetical protein